MVNGKLVQYDDMLVKYGHGGDTPEPTGTVIGGRWYRTVTIGGKEWLAENLDYTFDGLTIGLSKNTDEYPAANYYNRNEERYGYNGKKCGLLYNWVAVKYMDDNKDTFFPGWHVPTTDDWDSLIEGVRDPGEDNAGIKLRAKTGWPSSLKCEDAYGFSVLVCGEWANMYAYGDTGPFSQSPTTFFWTINKSLDNKPYHYQVNSSDSVTPSVGGKEAFGMSVRLVKDS